MDDSEDALNKRRGRSGRPLNRLKQWLKENGDHVCCVCARPIDMELSRIDRNNKWAWTLDHHIPLSKAPHLALERSNAREAHRTCNSAKGNREVRIATNASRRW